VNYKINFSDNNQPPMIEIYASQFINSTIEELAELIRLAKQDIRQHEKKIEEAINQEVNRFKQALDPDKIDEWSEKDNVVHALTSSGRVPDPHKFDEDMNFVAVPYKIVSDEQMNEWLAEVREKLALEEKHDNRR